MKDLCVVHLVRAYNGIEPFRRFLESYRTNPGGIEHDLLIVFKGFDHPQDTEPYRALLTPFQYAVFEVSDQGFDITAYFAVLRSYPEQYRYYCFLNSYSVIQDREWLKKLYKNISRPGVGLVGATGSWNSSNTNARYWFRVIGASIFRKIFMKNQINREDLSPGENCQNRENRPNKIIGYCNTGMSIARDARFHSSHIIHFGPFPNYHIRTNAFIISGVLMKSLEFPAMKTKMDAYKFESGKRGLTMQILNKGKRVIVVGKDGLGYEKEAWHESKTFWISDQENLLVADNQTRDYQDGTAERRRYLSSIAWGIPRHSSG